MNRKIQDIIQYIITIIVTMTVVFSLALISELSLLWRSEKKVVQIELSKKIFGKFYDISELEKYIIKNPNDYMAQIKLAQNYDKIQEYASANIYFQSALKISERSNYALFSYSLFCIKHKLYDMALNHAEEISLYNKKAIKYKAVIYERIAEAFDEDGEIEGSVKAYQVAYKYAKGVYSKKELKKLKTNYAKEYIKNADIKIAQKKMQGAVLDINNSLKIKELPAAQYKLALIYRDIDKIKAERLMTKVLGSNPYIVNPYIYNELLNNLQENARLIGDTGKINYYRGKINSFNKLLNQIYVFKDDIEIEDINIFSKRTKLFSIEEIYLDFNIRNDTKNDISGLFILIELYCGSDKQEFKKKVASQTNIFKSGQTVKTTIKFPASFTKDDIAPTDDIIAKCYAKKQKKAPWTLIKIQRLKK